jgi:TBC1 domain family protein 5
LRYIDRPGEVASAVDPLDEDPDSPWNVLRRDDEMRAEIFQDVERCMPDEPYFRQRAIQLLLLDILFIWCKLNPDVGYRQGMHEIVAPVLWVLEQDSFKRISEKDEQQDREQLMLAVLDNSFLEHDVFTIFSLIMQSAKSFYELGEQAKNTNTVAGAGISQNVVSPIVMRSKRIHEVYLVRVDPELADHLTAIEVLPQIFLM